MSLAVSAAVQLAWHEITLVVFTALAPSGILACVLCVLALMAPQCIGSQFDEGARTRLSHLLALPLAVSMVGLVASASHLGTPSNALYVLSGIGRSPLSNEVACCVLFTALMGLYWLYSFSAKQRPRLCRAWRFAIVLAGLAAVVSISLAYSAETILTWSHWSVPVSLCCSALGGAPLLALVTARLAKVDVAPMAAKCLLVCGIVGALACAAACLCWWDWAGGARNAVVMSARDLVPAQPLPAFIYALFALGAYAVTSYELRQTTSRGIYARASRLAIACTLYFTGLFTLRFAFYMTHMTVGISL